MIEAHELTKRYGDTMPSFEAHLAAMSTGAGGNMRRMGASQSPGVDQIAVRDLDPQATEAPAVVLDADDTLHEPGYTDEEAAIIMVAKMASAGMNMERVERPSDEVLQALRDKTEAWNQRWLALITAADPDALITVVDAHS
jgi:hypothetical protein